MNRLKQKKVWVGAAVFAALLFAVLQQPTRSGASSDKRIAAVNRPAPPVSTEAATDTTMPVQHAPQKVEKTPAERNADFVAGIHQKFQPHIHIKHAQIRFLEQLISYLKAHYPDDWQSRIYAFIDEAFPELADALNNKFDSLQRYNEWLLADRDLLKAMSPEERRAALWAKRYSAFGTDAKQIWAAELKNIEIQNALSSVSDNGDMPVDQKLDTLITSINDAYGEQAESFIQSRRTELINKFLAVDTVQSELRALPTGDRRQTLREIREKLGMNNTALDRWEALDTQRDAAWESGTNYMAQREQILASYDGYEKTRELHTLQQQLFGAEAEIIRREEANGFYRFKGEREIGRE